MTAFPTALAFTAWAFALGRTNVGVLGSTTYLARPIAIVLGWPMLGAPPAPTMVGGAVSLAGVIVARSRSARGSPRRPG